MSDMLSQEEINALLAGGNKSDTSSEGQAQENQAVDVQNNTVSSINEVQFEDTLSDIEKDAIGEIGNISMGSAATTMFTLLQNRVEITTPRVMQTTIAEIAKKYPIPFISVFVRYSVGINGTNLLILKEDDVKIITSLMMGGDGKSDLPDELTDLHLSAISEAMNQMMGASATSLAEMIDKKVDITPPVVNKVSLENGKLDPGDIDINEPVICTAFDMTIGDIIDSEIMQILPIDFAKLLVETMMGGKSSKAEEQPEPKQEIPPQSDNQINQEPSYQIPPQVQPQPMQQPQPQMPPQPQGMPMYQEPYYRQPQPQVQVQPVQFSNFDANMYQDARLPENIDLIKDVMLKITVELGKTVRPINEILDFKPGSIIELDKLVGESLDILANGKKIAMGEVVVIDENYGMRITDIVKQEKKVQ
nr:flagellar motor switch phosphatase FliY [uncultured Criibacterium sp.]